MTRIALVGVVLVSVLVGVIWATCPICSEEDHTYAQCVAQQGAVAFNLGLADDASDDADEMHTDYDADHLTAEGVCNPVCPSECCLMEWQEVYVFATMAEAFFEVAETAYTAGVSYKGYGDAAFNTANYNAAYHNYAYAAASFSEAESKYSSAAGRWDLASFDLFDLMYGHNCNDPDCPQCTVCECTPCECGCPICGLDPCECCPMCGMYPCMCD